MKEDIELIAAFLRACRELVRFDLKLDFGLGVVDLLRFAGKRIRPSSGSSSCAALSASGWSDAHSSAVGSDLEACFLKFVLDFRLRNDSGVDELSLESMEESSASSDGTDSADRDRIHKKLSSGTFCADAGKGASTASGSSNSILNAGLLP